jgi:Ca2+-binding EF-hand superfamily protein
MSDLPRLKIALKNDLKANARTFWDLLKKALDHKYSKTTIAFDLHSCKKDHVMSLHQFQELCESVGLTLDPRVQKGLFEMMLKKESDVAWTFNDFQQALLAPKIDSIRNRLSTYNNSVKTIQGHIDQFIKRLAIESGDANRRHAIARLQKKLSLEFCADLHAGLQRHATRIVKLECPIRVEDFMKVIDITRVFQDYENGLVRNIFDRVDRSRCGSVSMSDLVVAFTLLASECADPNAIRMEKMRFLFRVFDTDGDGCLTGEEILRMYASIVIHSAIAAGDQPSYDADMALGDELSLSKARRLYDFTFLFLQQSGVQDLCTFQELWTTFAAYPKVMDELIPGTHGISMMWVLRPVRQVPQNEVAKGVGVAKTRGENSTQRPVQGKRLTQTEEKKRDSKWNLVSSSLEATKQLTGAAKRPTSRAKSLEVNKTERFRIQAAIRFRHALRGEWDVVNSLQSAPPQSRENWFDSSHTKLPSLGASGSGSGSPTNSPSPAATQYARQSSAAAEKLPSISWAEATYKFDRRQKEGTWQNIHRQSLTNWSHGHDQHADRPKQLRVTRSMPELKRLPGQSTLAQMSAEEVKLAAQSRIAEITSQEAKVMEASQEVTSPQRWGKEALVRVRNVAKAHAAAGSDPHHHELPTATDDMIYDCQLCHGRHRLSVPCLY